MEGTTASTTGKFSGLEEDEEAIEFVSYGPSKYPAKMCIVTTQKYGGTLEGLAIYIYVIYICIYIYIVCVCESCMYLHKL